MVGACIELGKKSAPCAPWLTRIFWPSPRFLHIFGPGPVAAARKRHRVAGSNVLECTYESTPRSECSCITLPPRPVCPPRSFSSLPSPVSPPSRERRKLFFVYPCHLLIANFLAVSCVLCVPVIMKVV